MAELPSLTSSSDHHSLAPLSITSLQELAPPRHNPATPLLIEDIAAHTTPLTVPSHRSRSPSNNLKRSNPFQFGSRYLEESDDVYSWNAWDHVDPSKDELFVSYANTQYEFQREHAVSEFDKGRFNREPEKWWDKFYGNNQSNFFKDRKWLRQEFPIIERCTGEWALKQRQSSQRVGDAVKDGSIVERVESTGGQQTQVEREQCTTTKEGSHVGYDQTVTKSEEDDGNSPSEETQRWNTILEVGAGAGNTAFPILVGNHNPSLMIHACDFSKRAVSLIRSNPAYNPAHIRSEVWDMASTDSPLPAGVEPGSVDVVLLIFAFSALQPSEWDQAVRNVWRSLRPGGEVCFRDYGRGDLAQVRFKKGRLLEEGFYVRGDGTRVYFFEEEELRRIWSGVDDRKQTSVDGGKEERSAEMDDEEAPRFEIRSLAADRRLLVNRQKKLKMYRCWMQGRFRKPFTASEGVTTTNLDKAF